jgi:c-di-AMP phosphodiesterase-like protein
MLKTTRKYLEVLTEALTQETGIKFQEGEKWTTNIQKRTFTYNPLDLLNMDYLTAKGIILHEIGHLLNTEMTTESQLSKDNPALKNVYNALEDLRSDNMLNDKYGEFSREALNALQVDSFPDCEKEFSDEKVSSLRKILLFVLYRYNFIEKRCWNRSAYLYARLDYIFDNLLTPVQKEKIQKIFNTRIYERLEDKTHKQLVDFIDNDIYPILKEEIEQENKNPPRPERISDKIRGYGNCEGEINRSLITVPDNETLKSLFNTQIYTLSQKLKNVLIYLYKTTKSTKSTKSAKTTKAVAKTEKKTTTVKAKVTKAKKAVKK